MKSCVKRMYVCWNIWQ